MKSYYTLIILLLFSFFGYSNNLNIVLRYDDPRLIHDSINEHLLSELQKRNILLTIAIIPADSNNQLIVDTASCFFQQLSNGVHSQLIEVAQHGYNHQKKGISEFKGVNKILQYYKLINGKHFLESTLLTRITTFIPPWNSYDDNTINALQQLGYTAISSDAFQSGNNSIQYFPCTLSNPQELLPTIRSWNFMSNGTIILMFHQYDFSENYPINEFINELDTIISLKTCNFTTIQNLTLNNSIGTPQWIRANTHRTLLKKHLIPTGIFISTISCWLLILINMVIIALVFGFLFWGIIHLIVKKRHRYLQLILSICYTIIIAVLIVLDCLLTPLKSLVLLFCLTCATSILIGLILKK